MNSTFTDKSPDDHDSSSDTAGESKDGIRPTGLLKRRKRISRACDECRRKKIRCDGKQPCTHCTVYSYECTYDQPSNRRRNHAPQYVENLEHRVHRAETLLHILIPNLDLNDPGIDAAVAQGWIPGAPGKGTPASATAATATTAMAPSLASSSPHTAAQSQLPPNQSNADMNLPSMIRAVAQIDIDENGNMDYHGHSSGLSFMHRMREHLGDLLGPIPQSTPFVKSRPRSQVHDSPRSAVNSPSMSEGPAEELPPKDVARQYCTNTIDIAAALLRVVHGPTFWASFNALYAIPQEQWTNEQHKFLPLMFSTMAVGCLYSRDAISGSSSQNAYESAIEQGFAYFKAARSLMDIADCRDLPSVQAVTFMIYFMQSTAKLSQCYAYIGVALRSAVRMGLHRSYPHKDHIEAETRKRVFWVIRSMDIYVGAMLGLPQTLSEDDIDQEYPAEVDDEYITHDAILPMPEGQVSFMTALNAQIRLVNILQKIVRTIYPIKVSSQSDKSYAVPYSAVREIEADLEQWKATLHPALTPSDTPSRLTRIQQLLRLVYAHAQVMLYRPFLHFVNAEKRSKSVDQRAYACAASFVNVSRNIVHITTQMRNKGLLNGAFWFIMYTSFFSILSLVYYAAENPDSPTTAAVLRDALEGKDVLASLASRSMAADRCTVTLNAIFDRLPAWMREGKPNPVASKKRQHNRLSGKQTAAAKSADNSQEDLSGTAQLNMQARANTFPQTSPDISQSSSSAPYGQWSGNGMPLDLDASPSSYPARGILPQNLTNPALPDVSAIMFPGGGNEPFHYPNQPLTTFESNHLHLHSSTPTSGLNTPQHAVFSQAQLSSPAGGLQTSSPMGGKDDNLEAQLYALPPYMQHAQAQQPQHMPSNMHQNLFGVNPIEDYANLMSSQQTQQMAGITSEAANINTGDWQSQMNQEQHTLHQHGLTPDLGGMYIQELFGGTEWNPVMHR